MIITDGSTSHRVAAVRITVRPPAGFPKERLVALEAVASPCA